MNEIAIWSKFKDYGDWCYQYRIPDASEFIEGFEFEKIHFTKTQLKPNAIKPYRSIDYDIEVWWNKYKVGKWYPGENDLKTNLKTYLEAGWIRVKKANERYSKQIINQNDQMKLFYYIPDKWVLERDKETKEITKYTHDYTEKTKYKYVVVEAETAQKGLEYIQLSNRINIPNKPEDHSLIQLNGEEAFTLSLGKELTEPLDACPSEIIILGTANDRFDEILPSSITKKKVKGDLKILSRLYQKFTKSIYKLVKGKEIKVKDKVIRVELIPIVPTHTTIVDTKSKYPSRRDPVTNRWKPVDKLICNQPDKSPNALVCIATKDRKEFKRVSRKDASEIISTQLADEKEWEYISKKEFRKLSKPKIGKAFTPHNMDKKYKRIPVEVEYIEQEMIRNSYRDEKTGKMVYLPITYKDTDRTFTKWEHQLYYDDQADNQYHYYKTSTPNPSSSKVAKIKRKKKHPDCLQGIKQPKGFNTYEVSFERQLKEGSYEFVYQVTAKTEKKAIIRGTNRLHRECSHHEYHRKHGMPNLPLFKPVVKLLSESDSNTPLKKESLTVRLIMPHVYNLPERKDKTGKVIPWTKKVTQLTTEKEKAEGGGIFKLIDEEIKTYTKYEVSYNRLDQSPFKKEPKKWKCPTAKDKNYNHPKKKIIVKRRCKNSDEKYQKYLQHKVLKYRTK